MPQSCLWLGASDGVGDRHQWLENDAAGPPYPVNCFLIGTKLRNSLKRETVSTNFKTIILNIVWFWPEQRMGYCHFIVVLLRDLP
ncbi:hypothetical protein EVA_08644 [gut metagenome]|uniref:Uncharacterized protein n=1 Tax=gut metagenome TaxID=749906 RepID=J9G8R0_9ZZZZ